MEIQMSRYNQATAKGCQDVDRPKSPLIRRHCGDIC